MNVKDTRHMPTWITTRIGDGEQQATGFFIQKLRPGYSDGDVRAIENVWLVTNRHVVLPNMEGKEILVDELLFRLWNEAKGRVRWLPLRMPREMVLRECRVHHDPRIDIAVLHVSEIFLDEVIGKANWVAWYALNLEDLLMEKWFTAEVGDDVLIFGHNVGDYDRDYGSVIVTHVMRRGKIATQYGMPFEGLPRFLVRAKSFPDSSGSVVISNPSQSELRESELELTGTKQFTLLGVYSSPPFPEREPGTILNGGVVWYSKLIPEIISNGVPISAK